MGCTGSKGAVSAPAAKASDVPATEPKTADPPADKVEDVKDASATENVPADDTCTDLPAAEPQAGPDGAMLAQKSGEEPGSTAAGTQVAEVDAEVAKPEQDEVKKVEVEKKADEADATAQGSVQACEPHAEQGSTGRETRAADLPADTVEVSASDAVVVEPRASVTKDETAQCPKADGVSAEGLVSNTEVAATADVVQPIKPVEVSEAPKIDTVVVQPSLFGSCWVCSTSE